MNGLYYIQHIGYCGNCLWWWKPDGKGYTTDLDCAWKVTREKATEIYRSRRGEDIPWPCGVVDAKTERHLTAAELMRLDRHVLKDTD